MYNYQTADPKVYRYLIELQKQLKENSTEAEKILWEKLRGKKIGYKFRRQHIIDCFIVDFVCLKQMLIIEVDGKIHSFQMVYDMERDEILTNLGFKIIRYSNEMILTNIDDVVKDIILKIDGGNV
jgi:very-short-patch-repair endonuclease